MSESVVGKSSGSICKSRGTNRGRERRERRLRRLLITSP